MDWFTKLEQRKCSVLFAVFLLLLATLAVSAMRDPLSYDAFWHLRTGQDWVEDGLSPWQDHYSFTYDGAKIHSPTVYFDLGLYSLVQWLGLETGFKVFKFTSMLLVLLMAAVWLRRIKAPVLMYCLILPMLVALLQMRATVRPELLSYSFSLLALILYERAKPGLTVRNMLPIVVLMLVWTNYHSSIIGYVIFCGLFLDYGLRQLSERAALGQWARWLAWGAAIVGVGFLNPGFTHPMVSMLVFPEEWKSLIQEYQSPLMYKNVPPVYILVLMTLTTLAMLLRQRQLGYLVVVAVLSFYAASMARVVTPAGIVILCLFAYAFSSVDVQSVVSRGARRQQGLLAGAALVVFLVPLLNDVITARAFVRQNMTLTGYFPAQMVEYMKDTGKQGRIFNEYELGGYLIYQLAPDSKVYIDGRTEILYPLEHYQRQLSLMPSPDKLHEEIEKFDIRFAVLRNTPEKARLMAQEGSMQLDYADVRYFLYSKDGAEFPLAGLLWGMPYCWKADWAEALADEKLKAVVNMPPASPLTPFLDFVSAYSQAEDKSAFLLDTGQTEIWLDSTRRFAGYRALSIGLFDLSRAYFNSVVKKEQKDYLAEALATFRMGDPLAAENLIERALRIRWDKLEFIDLVILEGLLREMQEARPLNNIESEYLDNLAAQVGTYALSASGATVSAETFCASADSSNTQP